MNVADLFYTDPVERFRRFTAPGATALSKPLEDSLLTPEQIRRVIEGAQGSDVVTAVSRHVAMHSSLSVGAAQSIVAPALTAAQDPATQAKAISSAVASVGVSGNVSLADPAMLGAIPRLLLAASLATLAILATAYVAHLQNAGWAAYASMTILGVLGIVGVLVLVMGYKSVTISGSATLPSA